MVEKWLWKKERTQTLQFWSNFNFPVSPRSWPKSKNYILLQKNFQPLSYPNISKSRLYLLSSFIERYDYLLPYLGYFWQDTGRDQESKSQNQNLTYLIPPTWFLVNFLKKNFGSSTFQFCGYRSQRTFQKNFNLDFQVWLLFLVPHVHLWKNK